MLIYHGDCMILRASESNISDILRKLATGRNSSYILASTEMDFLAKSIGFMDGAPPSTLESRGGSNEVI